MPAFRGFQYRENIYRGGAFPIVVPSTDLVVFNNFSLADNVSTFCTDLTDSAPSREIIGARVPRDDGEYVNGDYWRDKRIEVRGFLKKSTQSDLETFLETCRKNVRQREGNLDITRKDSSGNTISVRRYVATWENPEELFSDRKRHHITICPYNMVFTCKTPFAKDRAYTSQLTTLTVSPTTQVITNSGTIEAKPVFFILFDAVNTGTVFNIENETTGEVIEYSGSFAAGDFLEFDSENMTVKKNSTAVDFTGSFPKLDVGSNSIKFTVTATSFSATVTTKWKPSYL